MADTDERTEVHRAEIEAIQRKARRREKRRVRNAEARGYMNGVLAMLKPGDLVIDCGANVGLVSEPLAQTGADLHCFEPDPFAFEKLNGRMQGHKNTTLHNVAVGTENSTVKLMRAEDFESDQMGGSVKSTILDGGRAMASDNYVEVNLIDFTDFLEEQIATRGEIAFLKMDIEGAELDLLEVMHAKGLIASIRCLVVETHENKFPELRPRFRKLRETFAAHYPGNRINLDWI
ncbi:MAG: FkbM family methyltransferase [Sulfitobacter sp.]|nr:FkbM family methyltransferase [Sulfitobacter sp.]